MNDLIRPALYLCRITEIVPLRKTVDGLRSWRTWWVRCARLAIFGARA